MYLVVLSVPSCLDQYSYSILSKFAGFKHVLCRLVPLRTLRASRMLAIFGQEADLIAHHHHFELAARTAGVLDSTKTGDTCRRGILHISSPCPENFAGESYNRLLRDCLSSNNED